MGEIGLLMADAGRDLNKILEKIVEEGLHNKNPKLFEEAEEVIVRFASLLMRMRVEGLVDERLFDELLQFREAK